MGKRLLLTWEASPNPRMNSDALALTRGRETLLDLLKASSRLALLVQCLRRESRYYYGMLSGMDVKRGRQ